MTALLLLFSKWNDGKIFGWHLVFSIMFLVVSLSNEENIDLEMEEFFFLNAEYFC